MSIETIVAAVVTLIAGLIIGLLIGRGSKGKAIEKSAAIEAELDRTREEVQEYRNQVNHHFEKTAELVGDLTESYKDMTRRYKKVYEHLAQGSQTLASVDASRMMPSSTIDRLIHEGNGDTHVAEKSAPGRKSGPATAQPAGQAKKAGTTQAPEEKPSARMQPGKGDGKKGEPRKPAPESRSTQPPREPKQPEPASGGENKAAAQQKKKTSGNG